MFISETMKTISCGTIKCVSFMERWHRIIGGVTGPDLFVPQSDEGSEKTRPRQDPKLATVPGPDWESCAAQYLKIHQSGVISG